GRDFSADLERNLFRLASFSLRLWNSLIVCDDGNYNTADVLGLSPFLLSYRQVPFSYVESIFCNGSWYSSYVRRLPCEDV
nr:hypothetical protein [Tanacetum cinerariifolium]